MRCPVCKDAICGLFNTHHPHKEAPCSMGHHSPNSNSMMVGFVDGDSFQWPMGIICLYEDRIRYQQRCTWKWRGPHCPGHRMPSAPAWTLDTAFASCWAASAVRKRPYNTTHVLIFKRNEVAGFVPFAIFLILFYHPLSVLSAQCHICLQLSPVAFSEKVQ